MGFDSEANFHKKYFFKINLFKKSIVLSIYKNELEFLDKF